MRKLFKYDSNVIRYQMKRVYSDELPMFNRAHYEIVKAVKKDLKNFPNTQFQLLMMGFLDALSNGKYGKI